MLSTKMHPSSLCATCRLRGLIRAKELGRSGWNQRSLLRAATQGFGTMSKRRRTSEERTTTTFDSIRRPPSRLEVLGRKGYFSTSARKVLQGFTRQQEIELVETLYASGQITRDEWRESVLTQAGLGVGKKDDVDSVDERIRILREYYGGMSVPKGLLEDGEVGAYERLFGELRKVEIEIEDLEDEEDQELGGSGTGVLKEDRTGKLEEVEFEEDETLDEKSELRGQRRRTPANDRLAEDIQSAMAYVPDVVFEGSKPEALDQQDELAEAETESFQRTHPLTLVNRFTTSPSTLELPRGSFVDPTAAMLANVSNSHLSQAAHRIFGGPGLPYSTSTPARGKTMQQKPITLEASQSNMSELEGNVYMSTLMPGIYASVMSVLVETRKRLGTTWAEGLVRKAEAGELRILDAGGAGAGVLAVREVLKAEWERMHADGGSKQDDNSSPMALAEADGRAGGEGAGPPFGHATVLTSSDVLRRKASKLLDNTTFVPRLPDYLHAEVGSQGKFDIVIAPHTLWGLREDYARKAQVQNLWSLLSVNGGILLLLEKGISRGFEIIAGARELLLEHKISSPGDEHRSLRIEGPLPVREKIPPASHKWDSPVTEDRKDYSRDTDIKWADSDGTFDPAVQQQKEVGMIIAPCTNHQGCPMYTQKGLVKGRRDICAFEQRYHRPDFLQRILGSKGRNHEDVEFSYLSVMRGKDLRISSLEETSSTHDPLPKQGPDATNAAFAGFESPTALPHSLSLPRTILPPLKRTGHVIMDVCTPSGTVERWTVPRSFSKQAFRDARKLNWGDLWALGAKTRILRNGLKANEPGDWEAKLADKKDAKVQAKREAQLKQLERSGGVFGIGVDEFGRVQVDGGDGGRVRQGRKVGGIRDKRDKKGEGNGRRKNKKSRGDGEEEGLQAVMDAGFP